MCDQTKDKSDFSRNSNRLHGFQVYCKTCMTVRIKKWRDDDPERATNLRRKRKYTGYTEEHGKVTQCQICNVDLTRFKHGATMQCIDHDHKTGKIRGVLCPNCNRALGLFQDNVEILKEAIRYLEQ